MEKQSSSALENCLIIFTTTFPSLLQRVPMRLPQGPFLNSFPNVEAGIQRKRAQKIPGCEKKKKLEQNFLVRKTQLKLLNTAAYSLLCPATGAKLRFPNSYVAQKFKMLG